MRHIDYGAPSDRGHLRNQDFKLNARRPGPKLTILFVSHNNMPNSHIENSTQSPYTGGDLAVEMALACK